LRMARSVTPWQWQTIMTAQHTILKMKFKVICRRRYSSPSGSNFTIFFQWL
jgi:hypothetical protein